MLRPLTGALALIALSATYQASAQDRAYSERQAFYLCGQLDAMFKVPSWHWRCAPDVVTNTVAMQVDHKILPAKLCADVTRLMERMNIGIVGWQLVVTSPTNANKPGITCRLYKPS